MNNVKITLHNGLGDKSLDLIGFSVICKYLNYNPHAIFYNCEWGTYDMRLFNFNEITILKNDDNNDECQFYINSPNPSSSLCPYKIYEFIKGFFPEISFEEISNDFINQARKIIKPSDIILSKIPENIENAYGIHLRKSDKVYNTCDIRHENTVSEFEIIINHLLNDVRNIIITEENPTFLIVSEDNTWKHQIKQIIIDISNKNNKTIKILDIDYGNYNNEYNNFNSVLDLFCLSKCKEILQGVKYSNFSILASILGNKNLRNYAKYTNSYNICLIHLWSSLIEINNNRNYDINLQQKISMGVANIQTNINKKMIS
jgi:hypothetical protein|uniref:Uncharacterized protein n=1 Tax=viral metagenome TaxID=1070528 RepID=A0A6C0LJQ2_9ZZZZ